MTLDINEFTPFWPMSTTWTHTQESLLLKSHYFGSLRPQVSWFNISMTYLDWMTCITLFNLLTIATNIIHVMEKMCVCLYCKDEQIVISVPKMSLICAKAMLTHCDITYNVLFYLKLHAHTFARAYNHSYFPKINIDMWAKWLKDNGNECYKHLPLRWMITWTCLAWKQ